MLSRCKFIFILGLSAFFLAFSGGLVHAQALPSTSNGVEISASSDNPVPGQTVTITANSYTININSAKVTWVVNGKTVQTGIGLTTLDVKAPDLGKKVKIEVTAVAVNGIIMYNTYTLSSGSVDLIIETDGYSHQFFNGKLPVVYQNAVKIVAMPHLSDSSGKEYDPKSLVYLWKKNDQVLQDQSGYGKQSITLLGDIVPRNYVLSVIVSTRDSQARAVGLTSVDFGAPEIQFYVDDPLYGPLFNRTVTNSISMGSQKETQILAVPFGFNKPQKGTGNIPFNWQINGESHSELAESQSVILRAPDDVSGQTGVSLILRNTKQILQGAEAGFRATFRAQSTEEVPNQYF
jgi:hypothetical protein